jgi:hypothetical protein
MKPLPIAAVAVTVAAVLAIVTMVACSSRKITPGDAGTEQGSGGNGRFGAGDVTGTAGASAP